jgi:hypothetical protein
MPDPSRLRDSTQIVLPSRTIDGLREDLEREFTLTIIDEPDDQLRIIGSPAEIKKVGRFLARHGVQVL